MAKKKKKDLSQEIDASREYAQFAKTHKMNSLREWLIPHMLFTRMTSRNNASLRWCQQMLLIRIMSSLDFIASHATSATCFLKWHHHQTGPRIVPCHQLVFLLEWCYMRSLPHHRLLTTVLVHILKLFYYVSC